MVDKDAIEEAVQGAINIMESHGISMIAASVPLAIIKGAPEIPAIPVEWLRQEEMKDDGMINSVIRGLLMKWQKEQEARM